MSCMMSNQQSVCTTITLGLELWPFGVTGHQLFSGCVARQLQLACLPTIGVDVQSIAGIGCKHRGWLLLM